MCVRPAVLVLFYTLHHLCLGSLKLECDKLASEKSEMQRHYIMVGPDCGDTSHKSPTCVCSLTSSSFVPQYYEMSYGLNIEMHKQVTAAVGQSPSAAQFGRSDCWFSSPQAEIVKRLNGICTQVLPYLSQEVTALLRPVPWLLGCVCVWPHVVFVPASAAGHGRYRESQASHTAWDELHHTGEPTVPTDSP